MHLIWILFWKGLQVCYAKFCIYMWYIQVKTNFLPRHFRSGLFTRGLRNPCSETWLAQLLQCLYKQVLCCVCPINDTDTTNMQKNVNQGSRNVLYETSVYQYPGLIVNREWIMSSVKHVVWKSRFNWLMQSGSPKRENVVFVWSSVWSLLFFFSPQQILSMTHFIPLPTWCTSVRCWR